MSIDLVSTNLIKIALVLDRKIPGSVSEVWIDEPSLSDLKASLPSDSEIQTLITKTDTMIEDILDPRRKTYLQAILKSLMYQLNPADEVSFSYCDFSEATFGYRIDRITDQEIKELEDKLFEHESKTGLSRQETFKKYSLEASQYQSAFEQYVQFAKKVLPSKITNFPDNGFLFEVTTDKPWSAFNSHIAPFKSKLTLNSDVRFTKLDLHRLAYHEAYGGHHSELSHKDLLLTQEGRGEHGLVITFSPQTFVSEAIAEGIFVLLGGLNQEDNDQFVGWYYDRLIFALQNAATFWFFDDKLSKEEILTRLKKHAISDKTAQNILNFSTDQVFGKYAPVYYTAFNFLKNLYEKSDKKDELITTLFTKPCTAQLLVAEFKYKENT